MARQIFRRIGRALWGFKPARTVLIVGALGLLVMIPGAAAGAEKLVGAAILIAAIAIVAVALFSAPVSLNRSQEGKYRGYAKKVRGFFRN